NSPQQRENETPRQLGCRVIEVSRTTNGYSEIYGSLCIDRWIALTSRYEQPQLGQAREQCAGKRRALAHEYDDRELLQALDERVLAHQMVAENEDLDLAVK